MLRLLPGAARPFVAAVIAVAATAAAGRADELDKVLVNNARAVTARLAAAGYANVGVLKFEARVGDNPVTMNLGRLNTSMATRLENVLIGAADPAAPIGITRGASQAAAARNPAATYRTQAGRAALFAHPYPLAWGDKAVPVDAFLIGRVTFADDLTKATLSLQVFDAKNPAALTDIPLAKPTVDVSRQMLADIDQPFGVRARGGKTPELATQRDRDRAADPRPNAAWETVDKLVDLKVFYDDRPVARGPDGNLPPPAAGQKVHFTARVKGAERLGLVLLVNGVNTIDKEANRVPDQYTRWVLEPGPEKEYLVRGYYKSNKCEEFVAARPADAARVLADLAPAQKVGELEVLVYQEVKPGQAQTMDRLRHNFRDYDGIAPSLKDAQTEVAKSEDRQVVSRSVIVPGRESDQKLAESDFKGFLAAHVVLRYTPAPK
ncbi:MAG: hypothetical protein U0871_28720 [Gemmataceae bacterium]